MSQPIATEGRTGPWALGRLDLQQSPPRWVLEALGPTASRVDLGPHVSGTTAGDLLLLKATIEDVRQMSAAVMRERVTKAYCHLHAALEITGRQPIRFWNFIPDLGRSMGPGLDRYMVFNAGRYDAFAVTSTQGHKVGRSSATASAVGVGGANLVVFCLASATAGIPVENPRQRPSWLYSSRYGPLPPCFSRATLAMIGGHERLLVGGTASIVGEESAHHGDAAAQLDESLNNLAAIVAAASCTSKGTADALERLRDVRVYVTCKEDSVFIEHEIAKRCPQMNRIEFVQARICRPELLLEIEAVATI